MNSQAESFPDDGLELIRRLEEKEGACCSSCGARLCSHQVLVSIALGSGNKPRCLHCTARQLGQSPQELAESMCGYFERRACYAAAWKWASEQEGVDSGSIPSCVFAQSPA